MPTRFRFGILMAILLALSGCYQSSVELFPRGEKLPLAGKLVCDSKKGQIIVLEERATGIPFLTRSYRYVGAGEKDPASHLAGTKVADNLWVFQSWGDAKSSSNGVIAWVETTENGVTILAPNLMGQSAGIEALFKKHKVGQRAGTQLGMLQLRGEPDDLRTLIRSHRREHLTAVNSCKKV